MDYEPTANILVVDDDRKSLMAIEALLAGPGRKIMTAESGAEALRCLLRDDFALILLDVRIPDMDGFETAALIRQRERSRYTPIIFISAIDTLEADVFRGVASGAVDYLFKPVVPQVLKAKVAVFVDLFQMNERLKQQVIRQSEERFRLVIESLQDYAVFMMDPEGRVTLWNRSAEKIRGWTQEDILGRSLAYFYAPEEQPESRSAYVLRQTVLDGRYEEEGWHRRSDGSQFWANTVYTAVKNDRGELIGFSAVTRDLTARKQAEDELQRLNAELERHIEDQTEELLRTIAQREKLHEQLLQAQKMESIGTLAGGIAHDFNNLLNVILGYAALIEEHAADPAQVAANLSVIQETVSRGGSLVRQLLALARKTKTKFEPLQINRLLEELSALLQETFPRTIEICLRLDAAVPPLLGDGNQLHQALLNLCLNSRDAMPDGGNLMLMTGRISGTELRAHFQEAPDEHYVHISVTDTGCGIDGTTRSRVFEPFFTTKPQGQGTGLGLAVVYGIVASHRGFIDLTSEPGEGTKVDLYLPLPPQPLEEPTVTARRPETGRIRRLGSGETILFVEDEPRQLTLMERFLGGEGFKVLTAKDGAEAVQIHMERKHDIDLVVLDLGLPKLNGWEAYKLMREVDPRIRAVFATGFMSREIEAYLEKGELSGVIIKPYQLHEVVTKICSILKKSAQLSPLATTN